MFPSLSYNCIHHLHEILINYNYWRIIPWATCFQYCQLIWVCHPKPQLAAPQKKFHPHLRKFKAKHLNTWYRMFFVVFTWFVLNLHEIGCSLRGWQTVDRGGSSILLHKFYQLFITLPVHQTIWWSFNIMSSAIFIFFAKIALNSTRLLKG